MAFRSSSPAAAAPAHAITEAVIEDHNIMSEQRKDELTDESHTWRRGEERRRTDEKKDERGGTDGR